MHWDRLWIGSDIATMENNAYNLIKNGAIATFQGQIVWVGPEDHLPENYLSFVEDVQQFNGGVITPGLIDCHSHLVYGGARFKEFSLKLQGVSYADISRHGGGIKSTVEATRKASFNTLLDKALVRASQMVDNGVTTIEIKSGYGLDFDTEIKMLRVAQELPKYLPVDVLTTFLGAHALPKEFVDADAYIDYVVQRVLPEVAKQKLASFVDVFCENIAFTLKQTERVFQAAQHYNLGIKVHAEQLSCQKAAALSAHYGAVSADHLEYVDEEAIKVMAQNNTTAVLLPGAYYFLKETQKPPVDLFRKHQVAMAVATDCNPGSSPTTSLQMMMNMACLLFGLTPEEALCAVTTHASKALNLENSLGQIKVGMQADFIHWDITHPDELSYYMGFTPSKTIIKRGVANDSKHIFTKAYST